MAAALPLDQQLCFSLYAASMAISRAYKPMLDAMGITYPQYLVLHALWEEDGRTIGQIADRLSLESSTVTPLVKRLEAAGHLLRSRSVTDERRVEVRLTASGAHCANNVAAWPKPWWIACRSHPQTSKD